MVNFELEINEVKAWLRQDPGHFDTMAQHFDDCRAPGNLLYKFEMTQHPYVQSCIEETCFGNETCFCVLAQLVRRVRVAMCVQAQVRVHDMPSCCKL